LTIAKPRKRNKEKGGGDQSREEKMPHKHELKRTTEWKKKKAFIFKNGNQRHENENKFKFAIFPRTVSRRCD
jgi:hypothetical protein